VALARDSFWSPLQTRCETLDQSVSLNAPRPENHKASASRGHTCTADDMICSRYERSITCPSASPPPMSTSTDLGAPRTEIEHNCPNLSMRTGGVRWARTQSQGVGTPIECIVEIVAIEQP
jgi:hypothetical protein